MYRRLAPGGVCGLDLVWEPAITADFDADGHMVEQLSGGHTWGYEYDARPAT